MTEGYSDNQRRHAEGAGGLHPQRGRRRRGARARGRGPPAAHPGPPTRRAPPPAPAPPSGPTASRRLHPPHTVPSRRAAGPRFRWAAPLRSKAAAQILQQANATLRSCITAAAVPETFQAAPTLTCTISIFAWLQIRRLGAPMKTPPCWVWAPAAAPCRAVSSSFPPSCRETAVRQSAPVANSLGRYLRMVEVATACERKKLVV